MTALQMVKGHIIWPDLHMNCLLKGYQLKSS